jgi:hypothetical protein
MKLSQLIEIFPALNTLAGLKLPAKTGFRIAKALTLIKPELEAYETQRLKLAELLGTKTEDGQRYDFSLEASKQFMADMNALTEEEITIVLPTIKPDDLGDVAIEPAALMALCDVFIVE